MLRLCGTASYLGANWDRAPTSATEGKVEVIRPFTWLRDNVLSLYYTAAWLSPDTNAERRKIKAPTVRPNPITAGKKKIPICQPILKPHELRLYEFQPD